MKKENLRIKENITLADQINAIETIVSSFFTNGDYTPYYCEMSTIIALSTYMLEGVKFETEELIYECYQSDNELKNIVDKFFDADNEENSYYFNMCNFIVNSAKDKVEFMKQQIIHTNPDIDKIVEAANAIIDAVGNFSKLNLDILTPENIQMGQKVLEKLSASDVDITKDSIVDMIKDAVDFQVPENEIIDGQRKHIGEQNKTIQKQTAEIKMLKEYKKKYEARNVLTNS